jgi:molybdopterin molybdotransferase
MPELLSVDVALERILSGINHVDTETIPLTAALGRVLAEDVLASTNLPPFDNSSMDGYAVRAADVRDASTDSPVLLRVTMDIPAGATPTTALQTGEAARIMTGAPMPEGADAVIPVEDTDGQWSRDDGGPPANQVNMMRCVKSGDYVRPAGEDIADGTTVLRAGTTIRPQEIGVLAALGQPTVHAYRKPRVALLTTGDELLDVHEALVPGKIRDSNSYTLMALVDTYGGISLRLPPARDDLDDVRRLFREALDWKPDMLISSAGVSVGAADLVRTVLAEMGEVDFWRINLRPGKPLAYGAIQDVPFFGLPGNPVSAMVTFDVLVRPALLHMTGKPNKWPEAVAVVDDAMKSDGRRSYIRVKLSMRDGRLHATSTGTQSSGALSSMLAADGLLIIPESMTEVPAGTELSVRLLRWPGSGDSIQ